VALIFALSNTSTTETLAVGTSRTSVLWNFHVNFGFSMRLFSFELEARTGRTDGQTDGRTGKTRNAAYEDERIMS